MFLCDSPRCDYYYPLRLLSERLWGAGGFLLWNLPDLAVQGSKTLPGAANSCAVSVSSCVVQCSIICVRVCVGCVCVFEDLSTRLPELCPSCMHHSVTLSLSLCTALRQTSILHDPKMGLDLTHGTNKFAEITLKSQIEIAIYLHVFYL